MTAEEYVQAHGDTFVKWLQDNTVECACADKYGCDESKRHCETIDAETEITCRRCFVPIGLKSVSEKVSPCNTRATGQYHTHRRSESSDSFQEF